jgi:hypothetical protein
MIELRRQQNEAAKSLPVLVVADFLFSFLSIAHEE